MVRVALRIVNGLSSTEAVEMGLLELEDGEIRDVKFADDEYLMVLWGAAGERERGILAIGPHV